MSKATKKDIFIYHNFLTGIVKNIEGRYTTIDLINESCVTGKVIYVDGSMNIDLEDAILFDARGTEHKFQNYFVQARNIRDVQIPEDVDMLDTNKSLSQFRRRADPKVFTFKTSRLKKQQAITLAEIAEASQSKSSTSKET